MWLLRVNTGLPQYILVCKYIYYCTWMLQQYLANDIIFQFSDDSDMFGTFSWLGTRQVDDNKVSCMWNPCHCDARFTYVWGQRQYEIVFWLKMSWVCVLAMNSDVYNTSDLSKNEFSPLVLVIYYALNRSSRDPFRCEMVCSEWNVHGLTCCYDMFISFRYHVAIDTPRNMSACLVCIDFVLDENMVCSAFRLSWYIYLYEWLQVCKSWHLYLIN